MNADRINELLEAFDEVQCDADDGTEYWLARDLQQLFGYAKWQKFQRVLEKAEIACENAGQYPEDHFTQVGRMIEIGKGGQREIEDTALSRFACYLVAQNGDPRKEAIAFAQSYFAVQTRKLEVLQKRIGEASRIKQRKRLTTEEKQLSDFIHNRTGDPRSFGRIRSKGDRAYFGGLSTQEMKDRLNVPQGRPLADFLHPIALTGKVLATEITNFTIGRDNLEGEVEITEEHVRNNSDIRKLLQDRGINPEELLAAEDAKKVERRLKADGRKLPKWSKKLKQKEEKDTDEQ